MKIQHIKIYGPPVKQWWKKKLLLNVYIRKEKKYINYIRSHLKNIEKEEYNKPKSSGMKEIIKTKAKINKIKEQ